MVLDPLQMYPNEEEAQSLSLRRHLCRGQIFYINDQISCISIKHGAVEFYIHRSQNVCVKYVCVYF